MTQDGGFVQEKKKKRGTYGPLSICTFSLFCLLLFLKNSDLATHSVKEGLSLCATGLIPTLFPFLVLSELILSGNLLQRLLKKPTRPLQKLLRLSPTGCGALLLGLLCGFPVGAKCAVGAYDRGLLSHEEAERILLLSSVPSAAFLINVVGKSLLKSRGLGLLLLVCALLSSLTSGLLLSPKRKQKEEPPRKKTPLFSPSPSGGASIFTGAVASATRGILLICAYVVFFSALSGALNGIFLRFHTPMVLQAVTHGILELSGGVHRAAILFPTAIALPLCAFFVGWSGISVHFQILSLCEGRGFRFRSYFLGKLLQGILCVLFCTLLRMMPPINLF